MKKSIIVGLMFVALPLLAQTAPPTWADGIIAWLSGNGTTIGVVVAVLEMVLRLIPSERALSVLVPVSYAVKAVASILNTLATAVLDPLAKAAQNTTAPKA